MLVNHTSNEVERSEEGEEGGAEDAKRAADDWALRPLFLLGPLGFVVEKEDAYSCWRKDQISLPAAIVAELPTRMSSEQECTHVSSDFVAKIREWLERDVEVRWSSQCGRELLTKLEVFCRLPSLDQIEKKDIPWHRPVVSFTESGFWLNAEPQNRFYECYPYTPQFLDGADDFLEDLQRTHQTFRVRLHLLENGTFAEPHGASEPTKVVQVTVPDLRPIWHSAQLHTALVQQLSKHDALRGFADWPGLLQHPASTTIIPATGAQHNFIDTIRRDNWTVRIAIPDRLPSFRSPSSAPRPLLWLDVDGVINPSDAFDCPCPEALKRHYDDVRTAKCTSNWTTFTVHFSPSVVNKINEWGERAEIRWLTSWQHSARYRLALVLGLRDFEVCRFGKYQATQVDVHPASDLDRPIIWIDD
jgi:hypothetical protein